MKHGQDQNPIKTASIIFVIIIISRCWFVSHYGIFVIFLKLSDSTQININGFVLFRSGKEKNWWKSITLNLILALESWHSNI